MDRDEIINEKIRISTMTIISAIDSNIDLNNLYEKFNISDKIRYIEYGKNPIKGEIIRKIKKPRKKKEKKYFYNQLTLHVFSDKIVNTKIFNNGRIQMTGIKSYDQGEKVVEIFLNELYSLSVEKKESIVDNLNPKINKYEVALINSDFDIGFKINREVLHRIIVSLNYYSSFEPSIYPGVNIKYYFNENNNNDGVCNCMNECNGKGKDGCCKKITIAVFNSGKIIITGGQSYLHLTTAYHFIYNLINEKKQLLINNN